MHRDNNSISVFYLSYVPLGINHLKTFLNSYIKFKSNIDHNLIILFNGFNHESEIIPFKDYLNSTGLQYQILLSREKFDIGSYFYAARNCQSSYILFFNTYSEILHEGWLFNLYSNIIKPNVGVVGCTGVWGDYGGNHLYRGRNIFNKLRSWLIYKYNFAPGILPHLRTNSFLIKKEVFLSLTYYYPKPFLFFYLKFGLTENKLRTFCFEHGKNSMTRQIIKKKKEVLLIDKFGKSYSIKDWRDSHIFWNGNQENLLVKDNQTMIYETANAELKSKLKFKAWHI